MGEVVCGDGYLYETLVLRAIPAMPASGLYSTQMYPLGLRDGPDRCAVRQRGRLVEHHHPAAARPVRAAGRRRPCRTRRVVLIHGGAFVGGSRSDYAGVGPEVVEPRLRGHRHRLPPRPASERTAHPARPAAGGVQRHRRCPGVGALVAGPRRDLRDRPHPHRVDRRLGRRRDLARPVRRARLATRPAPTRPTRRRCPPRCRPAPTSRRASRPGCCTSPAPRRRS